MIVVRATNTLKMMEVRGMCYVLTTTTTSFEQNNKVYIVESHDSDDAPLIMMLSITLMKMQRLILEGILLHVRLGRMILGKEHGKSFVSCWWDKVRQLYSKQLLNFFR